MRRFLLSLIFLATPFLGLTQTPAHFFLGADELAGIHIYDIHQDKNLNYWIASNEGLFKYNGYEFKSIECEEMLSPSLFNVISDAQNNVYCHNLSGQVFEIHNDTCSVLYQVPDSLVSAGMEILIDSRNNIIISAKEIIRLKPNKTVEILFHTPGLNLKPMQNPNGTIKFLNYNDNNYLEYGEGITESKIPYLKVYFQQNMESSPDLRSLYYQDQFMLFDRRNALMYSCKNDSLTPVSQLKNRRILDIYKSDQTFWCPYSDFGIVNFSDPFDMSGSSKEFFSRYKISAFLEDQEGNILLGTFKHGIIVIPKTQVSDFEIDPISTNISQIRAIENNKILFGLEDGRVGDIDENGTINFYDYNYGYPIELLGYLRKEKQFFIGSINFLQTNFKTKPKLFNSSGTFKDLVAIPNDQYLVATNAGLFIYHINKKLLDPLSKSSKPVKDEWLYLGRTYCVSFDSINRSIYLSSSVGFKRIDEDGTHEMKLNGKNLLVRDIIYSNNKIYATCNNDGLIVIENNKIIAHWTTENYLISNNTGLITPYGEDLIVATDQGIQILTPQGQTKRFFNKSDGLYADRIINLELQGSNLWILHQKCLQKIDLTQSTSHTFKPNIKFESIQLNNKVVSPNSIDPILKYDENKIAFTFSSQSLKYQNEIRYQFRLAGVDQDWQVASYEDNQVNYKTLPAGHYTFQVRALSRSSVSETLSYSFSISAPFWTKWWFYVCITVGLALLIYIYSVRQIRKQQRKALMHKELYESKLTAIQAQMNPHFIFNSLNSIQDLVLRNDSEQAYRYISKFALLVRNTLNHSDTEFIDYTAEISSLELYLSLEKLRFIDSFDYTITSSGISDIQIPPMLIQPFLENALLHGLLHKDGNKKLTINFSLSEALICTIVDNGIGRKEAKRIQKRQHVDHKSFAINAIKKRLEILAIQYNGKFEVIYEDLEEDGSATGTKVILKIPFTDAY